MKSMHRTNRAVFAVIVSADYPALHIPPGAFVTFLQGHLDLALLSTVSLAALANSFSTACARMRPKWRAIAGRTLPIGQVVIFNATLAMQPGKVGFTKATAVTSAIFDVEDADFARAAAKSLGVQLHLPLVGAKAVSIEFALAAKHNALGH